LGRRTGRAVAKAKGQARGGGGVLRDKWRGGREGRAHGNDPKKTDREAQKTKKPEKKQIFRRTTKRDKKRYFRRGEEK